MRHTDSQTFSYLVSNMYTVVMLVPFGTGAHTHATFHLLISTGLTNSGTFFACLSSPSEPLLYGSILREEYRLTMKPPRSVPFRRGTAGSYQWLSFSGVALDRSSHPPFLVSYQRIWLLQEGILIKSLFLVNVLIRVVQ